MISRLPCGSKLLYQHSFQAIALLQKPLCTIELKKLQCYFPELCLYLSQQTSRFDQFNKRWRADS